MIEILEGYIQAPEFWGIVGFLLAIAELGTGAMIALPLGCSALVVSILIYFGIISGWKIPVILFSVLGFFASLVFRKIFRSTTKKIKDINDY